mmetsp:Transcript_82528/g.250280  ORF Transcript_82528/g.250280 Transcript_82528/m.250280 type:complete len:660 (+) Transcript_82528:99-2078(+)
MIYRPLEFTLVVHVEFARRLRKAQRHVRVVLLEEPSDRVHALGALRRVVDAVPEAAADALVQLGVVLLLVHALGALRQPALCHAGGALGEGVVPELVVVADARELVEHDLARLLVAVGAVGGARGLVAMAAGHALETIGALGAHDVEAHLVGGDLVVGEAHGGAGAGQGVPQRRPAVVRALLAGPVRLVLRQVGGNLDVADLAAHDEAVVVVDVLADGRGAPGRVVGDEGPELALVGVPELPGVLHGHLEAPDAVDVVLPRRVADHLVVQVPHDSREVGGVDVLQRVAGLALRAVHVEGLRPGARGVLGGRRGVGVGVGVGLGLGPVLGLSTALAGVGGAALAARLGAADLLLLEEELLEVRVRGAAGELGLAILALVPLRVLEDAVLLGPLHLLPALLALVGAGVHAVALAAAGRRPRGGVDGGVGGLLLFLLCCALLLRLLLRLLLWLLLRLLLLRGVGRAASREGERLCRRLRGRARLAAQGVGHADLVGLLGLEGVVAHAVGAVLAPVPGGAVAVGLAHEAGLQRPRLDLQDLPQALIQEHVLAPLAEVLLLNAHLWRLAVPARRVVLAQDVDGVAAEDLDGPVHAVLAVVDVALLLHARQQLAQAVREEDAVRIGLHCPLVVLKAAVAHDLLPDCPEDVEVQSRLELAPDLALQ